MASEKRPSLSFDFATPADDEELRRLLRQTPMTGLLSVAMQREPSFFFGAGIEGDSHDTVVARVEGTDQLAGLGSRSAYDAYVNGQVRRLGYLSQVRLAPAFRGGMKALKHGFSKLKERHDTDDVPFYTTTIVEDNMVARKVLTKGWAKLPRYRERETITTFFIPLWRPRRELRSRRFDVRRAEPGDLPEIASCLQRRWSTYQFAPHWTADDLADPIRTRGLGPEDFFIALSGGRVAGCVALWDQRAFKQSVVTDYQRPLKELRPLVNMVAPLVGLPHLPPVGEPLSHAYLSHLAVDDRDPEMMLALVTRACNAARQRKLDYVTIGFAERHPLLPHLRRAFRGVEHLGLLLADLHPRLEHLKPYFSYREYRSILYVVHWTDGADAVEEIDDRVPHLEVAVL